MKETFFEYLDIIQVFFQNIIDNILNFDYVSFFVDYFSNFQAEDLFKIIVVYVFLLWIAIVIWVTRDILSRSNSIIFQMFCILLVVLLTPIFGLIIYFIIRPSHKKYIDDDIYEEVYEEVEEDEDDSNSQKDEKEIPLKIEEKIEEEKIVASFEKITCYNCHYHIEEDFKFCPNCEIQLLDSCKKCSKEIKTNWKICPYCGEKIEKEKMEKENNIKEEKKVGLFSKIFNKNKKINRELKEEKTQAEIKVLESEQIEKEIKENVKMEKTQELKKEVKNKNIRKSRKQRRIEKYSNKQKNN